MRWGRYWKETVGRWREMEPALGGPSGLGGDFGDGELVAGAKLHEQIESLEEGHCGGPCAECGAGEDWYEWGKGMRTSGKCADEATLSGEETRRAGGGVLVAERDLHEPVVRGRGRAKCCDPGDACVERGAWGKLL